MVALRPAASLDSSALAALFTAAYEGYWFPIALDEAGFARMAAESDVDLELSRVAVDRDRPVGIALLAHRETEGWIGGMGVVANRRREGIGEATLRATLDAAREARLERVTLEVLEQNVPARTLYERLGFAPVRDLDVWHLAGTPGESASAATVVATADAHGWLGARRVESEPWQRADGTLAHLEGTRGLMVDGAAAVVRVADGRVSVVQLGGEPDALAALLTAARSLGESLTVLNLPADDPARPALERLGGEVRARQHEMALTLASGRARRPRASGILLAGKIARMHLRVCLVTPHAWSVPHDTNEHVEGVAAALRGRGHEVVVLAPSSRSADLQAGRRALQDGSLGDVVAVSRAVPVSPRAAVGMPVGVRASVATALRRGDFDIVHGFDPAIPGLSYVALLESETTTAATFVDPERLGFPARRAQRNRLLARIDTLLATGENVARRAAERFPGEYTVVPPGVDLERFRPGRKRNLVVIETTAPGLPVVRAALRALRELPGWEVVLLRTARLAVRPSIPMRLRGRIHVRTAVTSAARAELLRAAAIVVPATEGLRRLGDEAAAAECALVEPPGVVAQPELAAAALLRLAEDRDARQRDAAERRASVAGKSFADLAEELERRYAEAARRRRPSRRHETEPLADRDWIVADLHMHTSHSHDCSIEPAALVAHAESEGLGAIAVTDHNVFSGAREVAELARSSDLIVIPGEEVKTDGDGEVIGLFLEHEIPRGMSFAETVAAIREQEGVVYVPHPFDRMHSIPTPATLHRHLPEIDVLEVYNARLLFDAYNEEALRFARKYGLLAGAGSDAHVLQGVGTGALRMRRFDGPEEFLLSLRTATVLRRPKSLAYLQSLKWVAQARERLAPSVR